MFENMTGVVGLAMHEDRQTQVPRNRRLAEAVRAMEARRARDRHRWRAATAGMLVALATRLAPGGAAGEATAAP